MTAVLLAGMLAGFGVAVPVGSIAILVMGLAARTSPRIGVAAALGVATADGLYAVIAVSGGATLARLIEPASGVLRWVAAGILVLLAAHTAVAAVRGRARTALEAGTADALSVEGGWSPRTPTRAYLALLGLTLLNPMTLVYFAAFVVGRQAASDQTVLAGAAFATAAFLASASWQVAIATGGSLLGRVLAGPRGRLATALVSSALIIVMAVRMLPLP